MGIVITVFNKWHQYEFQEHKHKPRNNAKLDLMCFVDGKFKGKKKSSEKYYY